MTVIMIEVFRILKGKWFWLSALFTVVTLWAGIGPDSYWLLQGSQMESAWLFQNAFTSSVNAISLPLLAALPGAALTRKELGSGSLRGILFRINMRKYLFSRVISLLFSSMAAQCIGAGGFILAISFLAAEFYFPLNFLIARVICAAVFAVVGSFGALLTRDTTCAYAVPIALCFALTMLRARFMIDAEFIDLLCWLSGAPDKLLFMGAVLVLLITGYIIFLYQEVRRNV